MNKNEEQIEEELETSETEQEETNENETSSEETEDEVDYKSKYEEALGRLKRAETKIEKIKSAPNETSQVTNKLSSEDLLALVKDNIQGGEELKIVEDYARFRNVSYAEALKSSVVKGLLNEQREFAKSKEVVSKGNGRTAQIKLSDEQILSKARKGENLSNEEIQRLANL